MSEVNHDQIKEVVQDHFQDFVDYIALPSVSTRNEKIEATANFVKKMIEDRGGQAQILEGLEDSYPFVYGEFKAGPGGNPDKTLLVYNHYDVQPEDPLDEWDTPPFELTEVDGHWVGRGVSDDKGELMARLYAIQCLKDQEGGLPLNIKFFIEGEEEIGSPHIDTYLEEYADLLAADACFWEGGGKDAGENIVLSGGIKGIAYFDIWVESASADIHSSRGAVVDNAAWRLVHALSCLRNDQHEILIDGFYDLMEEPSDQAKAYTAQMPFDAQAEKDNYDLRQPLITDQMEISPQEALVLYPTLTISGMEAGFTGEGTKTIVPRAARAKLDFRLVPGYQAQDVEKLLRDHLDRHGFEDVQIQLLTELEPFRTDLDDPFVQDAIAVAKDIYGEDQVVVEPNSAGGGPMASFYRYLGTPIIGTGVHYAGTGPHAPNENIRIDDFYQGVEYFMALVQRYAN